MALGALLLVSGCSGGGDASAPEPTVTETVTADPTSIPEEPTSPASFEPNVGKRALKIGATRKGSMSHTTLLAVRRDLRGPYEPEPNREFLGLHLKQCLLKGADPTGLQTAYNGEFAAVDKNGAEYPGGYSWADWPTPRFPDLVTMTPGSCVTGWMTISIPHDFKPERLMWRPNGVTTAEWTLPAVLR